MAPDRECRCQYQGIPRITMRFGKTIKNFAAGIRRAAGVVAAR
ncbi:MAG: hypothetical protein OXD33_01825 [Rhodobacteraceae bacterium]|nr:hypothetical protein [Paracoccaceae bacterium]